jgi:L,D-peptidoglycan transpeptidase YkuD (ErfK/YbiS/YcfS/YnhG family)
VNPARQVAGALAIGAALLGLAGCGTITGGAAGAALTRSTVAPALPPLTTTVPPTTTIPPTTTTTVPATTTTVPPTTTTTVAPPCETFSAAVYGVDPNAVGDTGGGSQLVTVVAPSGKSLAGALVVWAKAGGCWRPVSLPGQPAWPWRAETGYGGLLPLADRVSGDGATPIGLFAFGEVIYGNSTVSPSGRYPYHHFVCGDWWDELPGSPQYESFQHVTCGVTPAYGWDSEALWTEVQPYQHFIDIQMPNPPDNASGIFLHDDPTAGDTAGCVALPNAELDAVLGWLNPAADPHILIAVG